MANISVFALGGLDENGKNCYVLEYEEQIFIINSGTKVPINSNNGVDTLIPNFTYLVKNKDKIKGIFITDVKNESFSALPWLLMQIPDLNIYTSAFNKILILDRLSKYKLSEVSYKIHLVNKPLDFGEVKVNAFELAGSMPGHFGIDFVTKDGDILFLSNFVEGNLNIYGNLQFKNIKEKITKNRKILALMVDSGMANHSGKAIDKIGLPLSVKEAFKKAKPNERIIVGAYDEEMVAINQILNLAKEQKRPIITYGKTYGQLLYLIRKIHPKIEFPEIIDYKTANKTENAVILITGSAERLYSRFLRITDKNDVFLTLKPSDVVMMIAPPVNGLESLLAVALDEVARITPKIVEVDQNEYYRHRPAREDLLNLVQNIKPQYIIPIQGLYRYLVDAGKYMCESIKLKESNCLILQNGKIAHFIDGKLASTNGKVKEVGDTIIDGFGIGDISSEVIAEREMLGREGVILITSLYNSKTKKLTGKLQINYVGVISKEDKKATTELIKSTISNILTTESFNGLRDIQERLRRQIRKRIFKVMDKEPVIIVTFNNI